MCCLKSRFVMRILLSLLLCLFLVPPASREFGQVISGVKMRQGSHTEQSNWYRIWSQEWVDLTKCTPVNSCLICLPAGWIYRLCVTKEPVIPPTPTPQKTLTPPVPPKCCLIWKAGHKSKHQITQTCFGLNWGKHKDLQQTNFFLSF